MAARKAGILVPPMPYIRIDVMKGTIYCKSFG